MQAEYKTATHRDGAIDTLRMLFEEFGFQVNNPSVPGGRLVRWPECPLILAARFGSVEFVKFLVEEMHADLSCLDSQEVVDVMVFGKTFAHPTAQATNRGLLVREYLAFALSLHRPETLRTNRR